MARPMIALLGSFLVVTALVTLAVAQDPPPQEQTPPTESPKDAVKKFEKDLEKLTKDLAKAQKDLEKVQTKRPRTKAQLKAEAKAQAKAKEAKKGPKLTWKAGETPPYMIVVRGAKVHPVNEIHVGAREDGTQTNHVQRFRTNSYQEFLGLQQVGIGQLPIITSGVLDIEGYEFAFNGEMYALARVPANQIAKFSFDYLSYPNYARVTPTTGYWIGGPKSGSTHVVMPAPTQAGWHWYYEVGPDKNLIPVKRDPALMAALAPVMQQIVENAGYPLGDEWYTATPKGGVTGPAPGDPSVNSLPSIPK